MTDMVETVARALVEVDANHEVFHQRPYMEWAAAAIAAHDSALKAENERLRALVEEMAEDIKTFVSADHPFRDDYPHIMVKFKRDMDVVNRAYAALKEEGDETG